jgi:hypothetical protein
MTALKKADGVRKKLLLSQEQGAAFILAVVASAVLLMVGTAFAMLIANESRGLARATAYDQALYVAESGIEDVLYQRAKNQGDKCFPFKATTVNPETGATEDTQLYTGANGALINGPGTTCDGNPDTDADLTDGDKDDMPCWPYNERLYANVLTFGPNFYCHDGSDPVDCPSYAPLAVWPAGPGGGVGWKDMEPQGPPLPLTNIASSSGKRYTTGFFTVCNDDSVGDDPATWNCLSPPCNRRVVRFSVVSVGEVDTRPGESVQRAVKVDIIDPALYSGVIDKYVDLTLMYETRIKGPIHINGWWNANQNEYSAILALLGGTLSFAPLLMSIFNPPDLVSVSFPEPPGGDPQPLITLGGVINWVHLPVRIDIPSVNWDQFENRMKTLYNDALGFYSSGATRLLKMENYDPGNMYNTQGAGGDEFPCSSSAQADANAGHNDSSPHNCRDAEFFLQFCESGSATAQTCCARNAGAGRIHNCSDGPYTNWSNVAFDLFNFNTGSHVTGTEPGHLGGGAGPRDRSLRYVTSRIFDLHFSGGGCGFLNPFACLTRDITRPQFVFMGRHEYSGKVFIDGTMGIGTRTPYHTCGPGDGTLSFWCIEVGPWNVLGITINFAFGVPHWHLGKAKITGELLVHGKLWMADHVYIDGGAIYADDHVIKDESSGMDLRIHMGMLLCFIVTAIAGGGGPLCTLIFQGTFTILGLNVQVWMGLDGLLALIIPWWPWVDLTNNGLVDFKAYLDINGWNTAGVINSGTLYSRGDVWVIESPGMDITNMLLNLVVGGFAPFLDITPAVDPVRIWNNGAIVANGREVTPGAGDYDHGNVYLGAHQRLDLMTYNPDTGDPDTGFVFARGALQVNSDIISHYGGGGLFDNCNGWISLDDDCAANGIFYSGGVTASTHPDAETKMFTSEGGGLDWNGGMQEYSVSCLHSDEPGFWADILGNAMCWLAKMPTIVPIVNCGTLSIAGGNCDQSEFNIQGYIFAGQVGAMPMGRLNLLQDSSVLHKAVTRRYYRSLVGTPIDWMEIEPPANVPRLSP